jgi:AcrR family transcriptional regulator
MPRHSKSAQPDPPATGGRRSQQEAAATRERILTAALQTFSETGFGATSLREIGARAGVSQQLITHHFHTKLALWKAVVDHIFGALGRTLGDRARGLEGVSLPERMNLLTREFLTFSADHPELARLMMHEGAKRGERLEWLVEHHVRPLFQALSARIEEAQGRGLAPAGDPVQIAYVLIGANTVFSQPAEFEMLTGRKVSSPDVVDSHTELVMGMLLTGGGNQGGRA